VALIAALVAWFQYRSGRKANEEAKAATREQQRLTEEANRQAAEASTEQTRLAIALAEEEARPYVMVFMEPSREGSPEVVDLVVKNFGKTAAQDVRIVVEPPLQRSIGENNQPEDVWLPSVIPTLVPGQEWRTLFDMGMHRFNSALPETYRVRIETKDSQGRSLPVHEAVLDWSQYQGKMYTTVRTMHDAATALREIEKHVKGWREGAGSGLRVFVRDGDARDARRREEWERRQVEHQSLVERVLPDRDETSGEEPPGSENP
jgi:hypothetical protein